MCGEGARRGQAWTEDDRTDEGSARVDRPNEIGAVSRARLRDDRVLRGRRRGGDAAAMDGARGAFRRLAADAAAVQTARGRDDAARRGGDGGGGGHGARRFGRADERGSGEFFSEKTKPPPKANADSARR